MDSRLLLPRQDAMDLGKEIEGAEEKEIEGPKEKEIEGAGKEIEVGAEEFIGADTIKGDLNDGMEAGASPRSETDDDAPLLPKKCADKKDERKAEDEVIHEEELQEVAGAPAIEFRKGLRTTFLRVVMASEAKNLISRRALLGVKNMPADRIVITHEGESVTGVLIAERWYIVTIAAKPKSKAKAKSKATAKTEAAKSKGKDEQGEPAKSKGKDEQEEPAKKRGRACAAVPDFFTAGVILDEAQDDEAEKFIGRLYKRKGDDEALNTIKKVRDMRAAYTRELGSGIACEQAYKAAVATQRHLKRATGSADIVVARTGALSAAFPCHAEP